MATVRDGAKHLRSLKDGGWKKCTPKMAEEILPDRPWMVRGHYVNEHLPDYNANFDRWGGEFNLELRHHRWAEILEDGFWYPNHVEGVFQYMSSFKRQLDDIAVTLYIEDARKHRPNDHPDWIIQATGEDYDIVWAEYDKFAQEKIDAYWALSHQKRRHVEFPIIYHREKHYLEEEDARP